MFLVCVFVQARSGDVSLSAKLPLSAVTPVPDVSEGHSKLKVQGNSSVNKLELVTSCYLLPRIDLCVCVCVCV